jgi:hypothetical protein
VPVTEPAINGSVLLCVWLSRESQRLFDGDGTEEYSKSEKSAKKLLSPSVVQRVRSCFPGGSLSESGCGFDSSVTRLAVRRQRLLKRDDDMKVL